MGAHASRFRITYRRPATSKRKTVGVIAVDDGDARHFAEHQPRRPRGYAIEAVKRLPDLHPKRGGELPVAR